MEKMRDVNKKIHDCIYNLDKKVTDALNKNIHYAEVNGVEDASLKLIDCLVEHEVVNKILWSAKNEKVKANQEHLVQENVPWDRKRASLLDNTLRRSKSLPRIHQTDKYANLQDCRKKLHSDGVEDGYKSDAVVNSSTSTCVENNTYYKCRVSLMEDQKIKLENDILKLTEERNGLTEKLQKTELQNAELVVELANLETRIFNEDPGETLCLKNTNLETTIERQKTLILKIQKRENQMQDELKDAEQALKYTKTQLEKCRDEKNDAKTVLSICDIEKDKLQCETDQLQKRLKKQKNQAEEQIRSLEKKTKDKERDLQQRTQCIDEMTKELKEIKIQKNELQLRNRNDQDNSKQLAQDNELLRAKLCELENRHSEEEEQQIKIECNFKLEISNLKTKNSRAYEQLRKVEKELKEINSKFLEQQSIFNSERCLFEEEIKTLKLQLDEERKPTDRWLDKSTEEVMAMKEEQDKIKCCLGEKSNQLRESEARFRKLETDIKVLQNIRSENEGLKASLEEITKELNNIEIKYRNATTMVQDADRNIQELNKTIENQKQENRDVNVIIERLDEEKKDLENKLRETYDQSDRKKDEINIIQKRLIIAEENVILCKEENAALQKDNAELIKNHENLSKQLKESESRFDKSAEENLTLEKGQDKLTHDVGNQSNELQDSKIRSRKLENAVYFKEMQTELNELRESFADVTNQLYFIEKSYKREKIFFDRLQREKYSTDHANCTLTLRLKQIQKELDNFKQVGYKKHSSPQHTIMLEDRKSMLTYKIISLKRQNAELEASSRKFETETKKIKSSFEDQNLELESLKKKYREEAALRASNDKIHIQHKNELQQLIKEKEDMSRNYEAKLYLCKTETEEKKREKAELIKDKGKLEKEIDDLKLRLLEDRPDMTLNHPSQVEKEPIKRAQVPVHYDEFLQQKSHKLGSKMKQLYKNEWKEAMTELESEDDKINIEFLLQILERAYSFSEHMVPRFADGFKAVLLSVSNDIEEIVDSTFLIREILDLLTNCMTQIFLRDPDSKQYKTKGLAVHTYIREAVAICWLMVIQKPPVFISTALPNKSQPESFDPYFKSKSETIDYVVWPVVKLSNNEGQVICTGIAEYK